MKDNSPPSKLLIALVAINTLIFLLLSLLHFYWAFGGSVWYSDVLPTNSKGTKQMEPGVIASFIVAIGLLLLAFITTGNLGYLNKVSRIGYYRYGALFIAILFSLRAIGDFKFVGFFKSVTKTKFAIHDTQLFSPLCAFIALASLLIFYLNKTDPHA